MNTSITTHIFNQTNAAVRSIVKDGEPWFIAKDVAEALGYKDTDKAIRNHCDESQILKGGEMAGLNIPNRGLTIINESDVYGLIFGSKLESAREFKRWVTKQVLPSLRKHGGYINGQETLNSQEQFLITQSTEALARMVPVKMALLLSAKRPKVDEKRLHDSIMAACMASVLAGEYHAATLTRTVKALHQDGLLNHAKKEVSVGSLVAASEESIFRSLLSNRYRRRGARNDHQVTN